jgi:hypothetical protein
MTHNVEIRELGSLSNIVRVENNNGGHSLVM